MKTLIIKKPTLEDGFSGDVYQTESVKIKLTPKQNMVINCLQQGFVIIAMQDMKNIIICNDVAEFWISPSLFFRLVNMGMIYQTNSEKRCCEWMLTELGKKTITKPVNI